VRAEYSEQNTNDTLRYLNGLFNVEKYNNENKNSNSANNKSNSHVDSNEFFYLKSIVDEVLSKSKYNKVDLGNLFSFMQ
jgi:hypothetical protein